MKSKIFTFSIILILLSGKAMACGGSFYMDPSLHYIFHLGYPTSYAHNDYYTDWKAKNDKIFHDENVAFWHKYTGKKVSKEEVEKAIYSGNKPSKKYEFFKYLIDKNDTVALQYWNIVNGDLGSTIRWERSVWYFPTKNEKTPDPSYNDIPYEITFGTIDHCPDRNIRNRYTLQLMRMAFAKRDNKLVVKVWDKYGRKIPASALRTQCKSYYAGAVGNRELSTVAFAEIGYFNPLLHYNTNNIKALYKHIPNSKHLELSVENIVNQHFDNCFGYDTTSRKSRKQESEAFHKTAEEILADGKSNNPALWKSAQAAFAYIDGDNTLALNLIRQADSLKGTKNVKENIRLMRLLFLASDTTTNDSLYENALLPDLQWLVALIRKDQNTENGFYYDESFWYDEITGFPQHRVKILRRTILKEIISHFEKKGRQERCLAYLDVYSSLCNRGLDKHHKLSLDYGSRFLIYADTTKVENVKKHLALLQSGGESEMDKFLVKNSSKDYNFLNELIGTKYIRTENWDAAIAYLKHVSKKFRKTQNIHYYLTERNPFGEAWITNSRKAKYRKIESPWEKYNNNPTKLQFCQTMKKLKTLSNNGKDASARAEARYAYVVGLYQAFFGKSWSLTRYSDSFSPSYDEHYYPNDKKLLTIENCIDKTLAMAGSGNKELADKLFVMKYTLEIEDFAEYYVPLNDWSKYDNYKRQSEKHDAVVNDMKTVLFADWSKRCGVVANADYVRRTYCDQLADHKPQKKETQKHTIYMPVNGRLIF